MSHFVGNILQNTFYACYCILLWGTHPKSRYTHTYLWRCSGATGAET